MRTTDLTVLYRGGANSGGNGVAYPVVLRNPGVGTFWDVALRVTHDGEETERKVIHRVGPESETDPLFLLIPSRLCDDGAPGVGRRPLGRVVFEALLDGQLVASAELPGTKPEEPEVQEPTIDHVPRSPEEEAELLRDRPGGWEYLLFASVLRRQMDALEPKYSDHELRYARPWDGPVLEAGDAIGFLRKAFNEASMLIENFNRLFDPAAHERAFGASGKPGDPVRITHLAERIIDVYEAMIEWAARLRGAAVEEDFRHAVDLASQFVDLAIQAFRDFVARLVAEVDRLPTLLREETPAPITITLTLVLEIDDDVQAQFYKELRRLEERFGDGGV
jgi:hypothetical protein